MASAQRERCDGAVGKRLSSATHPWRDAPRALRNDDLHSAVGCVGDSEWHFNEWQPHTRRSLQAPFACELWSRALLLAEVVVVVGCLACEAAAREAESGAGMRKWYINYSGTS
jgi:hypothetical protein